MKLNLLFSILWIVQLSSCQSKYEKMQGHWHSVITEEQPYSHTFDVIDSIVIFDAYCITNQWADSFQLIFEDNKPPGFYGFCVGPESNYLSLENNSLYFGDYRDKYVKQDIQMCRETHFYEDLMVEINLNECGPSSISLETAKKSNYLSFISIGKPKYDDLREKINKDSTIIQVAYILMNPSEIPKLIFEEKDKLDVNERLGMFLIIDQSASVEVIDSVYSYLNPDTANLDLYKACFNSKIREVEYVKIKERNDLH